MRPGPGTELPHRRRQSASIHRAQRLAGARGAGARGAPHREAAQTPPQAGAPSTVHRPMGGGRGRTARVHLGFWKKPFQRGPLGTPTRGPGCSQETLRQRREAPLPVPSLPPPRPEAQGQRPPGRRLGATSAGRLQGPERPGRPVFLDDPPGERSREAGGLASTFQLPGPASKAQAGARAGRGPSGIRSGARRAGGGWSRGGNEAA